MPISAPANFYTTAFQSQYGLHVTDFLECIDTYPDQQLIAPHAFSEGSITRGPLNTQQKARNFWTIAEGLAQGSDRAPRFPSIRPGYIELIRNQAALSQGANRLSGHGLKKKGVISIQEQKERDAQLRRPGWHTKHVIEREGEQALPVDVFLKNYSHHYHCGERTRFLNFYQSGRSREFVASVHTRGLGTVIQQHLVGLGSDRFADCRSIDIGHFSIGDLLGFMLGFTTEKIILALAAEIFAGIPFTAHLRDGTLMRDWAWEGFDAQQVKVIFDHHDVDRGRFTMVSQETVKEPVYHKGEIEMREVPILSIALEQRRYRIRLFSPDVNTADKEALPSVRITRKLSALVPNQINYFNALHRNPGEGEVPVIIEDPALNT
ncbi:MAG: hypothetical protein ABII18_05895 [bacterium]|nr:hypothetical protein [bacterium]MBU1917256.1 hypothetical protein [bacterium]